MVALVVETGGGVTGANSYVSLDYATDYFETHAFHADAWDELEPSVRQRLLIAASRQLDVLFDWAGLPATTWQGLQWPRTGVHASHGGYLSPTQVPERLRQAVCEQAFLLSRGDPGAAAAESASEGLQRIKIDVIELEFSESASTKTVVPGAAPTVLQLLRGLGNYTVGFRVRKVLVG